MAYTPASELTVDEHKSWATKMGMAVLLGRHIFNIAELVSNSIHNFICTVGQIDLAEFGWN